MSNVSGAKKIGRPKKDTVPVNVRLSREMVDRIDQWARRQAEPIPSRPEVVRRLIEDAVKLGGLDAAE